MRYNIMIIIFIVGLSIGLMEIPANATEPYGTLEAGLIEWSSEYLKAVDGFKLNYDGNWMSGEELYLDIETEVAELVKIDFSACQYDDPHYLIHAKKLLIYPQDRLVFEGAKIQFGAVKVPIPFTLVLNYKEGGYAFPDWIPKLFYSGEKGIGVQLKGSYLYEAGVVSGTTTISSQGGFEGNIQGVYSLTPDLQISKAIGYEKRWRSLAEVSWREGQKGFGADFRWDWVEQEKSDKEASLKYTGDWWNGSTKLLFNSSGVGFPSVHVDVNQQNLGRLAYTVGLGVTRVTDKDDARDYSKVKLSYSLKDEYTIKHVLLGWEWSPTHTWVQQDGINNTIKTNLWIQSPMGSDWEIKMGYFRTSQSEESYIPRFYPNDEAVELGLSYKNRNEFGEGWSWKLESRYNLTEKAFESGKMSIIRALDCYDWDVDIDLVQTTVKTGIQLKY